MQRKSSRGNPWHDEKGRFCSGPETSFLKSDEERLKKACEHFGTKDLKGIERERLAGYIGNSDMYKEYQGYYKALSQNRKKGSQKTKEEYEEQTRLRRAKENPKKHARSYKKAKAARDKKGEVPIRPLTIGDLTDEEREQVMADTFTPDGNGRVLYQREPNGKCYKYNSEPTENRGEFRTVSREEVSEREFEEVRDVYENSPWLHDPKYKDKLNAKLLYLADHPEHKYNNHQLIMLSKAIQTNADHGRDTVAMWERTKVEYNMTETEMKAFVGEEFKHETKFEAERRKQAVKDRVANGDIEGTKKALTELPDGTVIRASWGESDGVYEKKDSGYIVKHTGDNNKVSVGQLAFNMAGNGGFLGKATKVKIV